MPLEVIKKAIADELSQEKYYSEYGTATNIDEAKRTCTFNPASDAAPRENIRLQSVMSQSTGFVLVPKEGSSIGVTFVNKITGFVAVTTEISEMIIDTELTIFNGGENGGMVNVEPLTTKINALEKEINILKSIFKTWIPIINDGGAALKALTATFSAGTLTTTTRNEIEDEKVQH